MTILRCETHQCHYDPKNGCPFCPTELETLRAENAKLRQSLDDLLEVIAAATPLAWIDNKDLKGAVEWAKRSTAAIEAILT